MPTNPPGYWSKNNGENYRKYQGTSKAKKERASRNSARRKAMKKGLVRKGDNNDVHHKDNNALNNSPSNLSVIKREENRKKGAQKANRK